MYSYNLNICQLSSPQAHLLDMLLSLQGFLGYSASLFAQNILFNECMAQISKTQSHQIFRLTSVTQRTDKFLKKKSLGFSLMMSPRVTRERLRLVLELGLRLGS